MKTTSHFIWIDVKQELFSDIFISIQEYIDINKLDDCIALQDFEYYHITLYYLEKKLNENIISNVKDYINTFDIKKPITVTWYNYFNNSDWENNILYFSIKSEINLVKLRNQLHKKYNRDYIIDNWFSFVEHITFLRILDFKIFEKHRKNIQNVITEKLKNINLLDINTKNIYLYAVNSDTKIEKQIKI